MKNIFRLFLLALLAQLSLISCDDEDFNNWTTPEPSFKLYDTTLGGNILYSSMEGNPFILTWDNTTGTSGEYKVVVSSTEDFASKVELGSSTTNTFKTTIGQLNTALLQAGLSPYSAETAYVRIEVGSAVSNTISFIVTTYPVAKPVITNPTAGSSFVLDSSTPSSIATTVTWSDYASYGVTVTYLVEAAKSGTSEFKSIGSVDNVKSLELTTNSLNLAALNAGLATGVAGDLDLRVSATTASTGGTITTVSDIVKISVTPYVVEYPTFYIVGDASVSDWNATNALKINRNESISKVYTYLENGKSFRFLGQQDWNPLNYSLDVDGIRSDYRYFKTFTSNVEKDGDENMKFTGASGIYQLEINADFGTKSLTVTPSPIPSWSLTNLYLVGSVNGWDAGNALEMNYEGNGKFEYETVLQDGTQFKFLGQKSWGDLEWANITSEGNSGYIGPKGDNGNITFDGGGNMYKISVNLKAGTFAITPL